MGRTWQLQEAKNKLSEVVSRAQTEGPQTITVRGKEVAVVVSLEEYRKARAGKPAEKQETLLDVLLNSPLRGSGVVIERRDDYGRDIDL